MHNKTPTEICLQHLRFSLEMQYLLPRGRLFWEQAKSLWLWLFYYAKIQAPNYLSTTSVREALFRGNEQVGCKYMAAIFINVIQALWKARMQPLLKL